LSRIILPFKHFGVIHVMTAQRAGQGETNMTYTIDEQNNITAFATAEEAAAATAAPFDTFTSEQELAQLAASWPAERLLAIWNSLPGVTPVKKLKNPKTAARLIWQRTQGLGNAAEPRKPQSAPKAKGGVRAAKDAPAKAKATKKTNPTTRASKAKKSAKESSAPREGSKIAQVIAMLQRKNGATIMEIVNRMGWQKHTVRGFMAGAMKKAGYQVESFKPEGGERSYRISAG
jgi:hypothetical protein